MNERHHQFVRIRFVAVFAVLAVTLSLAAAESSLPPSVAAQGWEEITFEDKQSNRYATCGADCVEIETDVSVSMIGRPVSTDLSQLPVLTWEWKIEGPVTISDLTTKGEDDRAVAVYVTFPYDPKTATLIEKLLRPVIELVRGPDAPSRVLSYVWGGFGKPGDLIESPSFGSVNAMIICRNETDPVGSWIMERFNVVADFERAFGITPSRASHVLVGADSDDTGTRTRAFVRNILFAPK